MFEYMAMAKPVVANEEIPEHKEVFEESGGGISVPFGAMGRKGREWVVRNRTYEILARQVEERYLELLCKQT